MVLHASTWTSVAVMYQACQMLRTCSYCVAFLGVHQLSPDPHKKCCLLGGLLLVKDALAGVAATIAFHGTCMALLAEFDTDANDADEQWWLEENGKDRWSIVHRLASRAAMASLFLMALALAMSTRLGPFMPGAILGGHVTLQVAALALALGPTTAMRQVAVLSLFGLSAILGLMLESVSLSNSGTLFLLLWFLAKCYETSWANPMFKVFMTLVAMQVVGTNPGLLLEILNPVNLYA